MSSFADSIKRAAAAVVRRTGQDVIVTRTDGTTTTTWTMRAGSPEQQLTGMMPLTTALSETVRMFLLAEGSELNPRVADILTYNGREYTIIATTQYDAAGELVGWSASLTALGVS